MRHARDGGEGGEATRGQHPHVGALDVAPVCVPRSHRRAARRARRRWSRLTGSGAEVRSAGVPLRRAGGRAHARAAAAGAARAGLAERMRTGEQRPDFGPTAHASHGRRDARGGTGAAGGVQRGSWRHPPRLRAGPSDRELRSAKAAREGMPGVRAIGVSLTRPVGPSGGAGVDERGAAAPDAAAHSGRGDTDSHAEVAAAELVGLAPRARHRSTPAL